MTTASLVRDSLRRSFGLYQDLIDVVDDETLALRLPHLPSNTLGQQLWCVVGARESFGRAIEANRWSGFACSLQEVHQKQPVTNGLRASADALCEVIDGIESFTDVQNRLTLDLLEHEVSHHGQLIRYLYGLRLTIPPSWKAKYALG